MTRVLAIDAGARHMGWAGDAGGDVIYGLYELPGTKNRGNLLVCARNALDDLVVRFKPDYLRYVPAFISKDRTSTVVGRALIGLESVFDLVCCDNDVTPEPLQERTVRKQILGICDFGLKDPRTGGIIPDSGRAEAKRVVLEWCASKGFSPPSHDTGDALVLLHYQIDLPKQKPVRRSLRGMAPVF